MTSILTSNWVEANQRYLSTALALVRKTLEKYRAGSINPMEAEESPRDEERVLHELASEMPTPAALTELCTTFGLSTFERNVLLLCAGVEFDGAFAALCVEAQGHFWEERSGTLRDIGGLASPTFALALSMLPDGHWDALTPTAPLRRWRLIEVGPGSVLTLSPLRIDEGILHYLVGAAYLDERLARLVRPLSAHGDLVPSQQELAERLARVWGRQATEHLLLGRSQEARRVSVIQLSGEDVTGKHMIAGIACRLLNLKLYSVAANVLPTVPTEIEAFMRLWERDAALQKCALLIDCDDLDLADKEWATVVSQVLKETNGFLLLSCRERLLRSGRLGTAHMLRIVNSFEVQKPHRDEQVVIWQNALGELVPSEQIEALMAQFHLSTAAFLAVSTEVLAEIREEPPITKSQNIVLQAGSDDLGNRLWQACRLQTRARLDHLAQRVESEAHWDDLVLPDEQRRLLQEIIMHVRQRVTVYESWGLGSRGARGLGLSVLFAGVSGTGKTSAAEVLAHELQLDLYRIDLATTVSKYIGETEKHLRLLFEAAEEGGAILLFDEADALFGKRSEVKESRDRYANIEVSYLLQRMETYRGLAILTTNFKSALDPAFLRRIRFIVQFPFPDEMQRAEIWRRSFSPLTPIAQLDVSRLAKLHIAGGNIRNIALNAAFLAADERKPVGMEHLRRAALVEYAKLEKPPTESEFGGWL